ncbi:hypothetical protein WR25_20989 [Diploscapter pachys]|uniref:Uncharacterized protein n=1 Tax=Diploscapter pachys TaxID=2018661 RepID=A0A2A2K3X4_9BILA|nr:hypothetical protein WR25_20989 [Diploscapter pachys]
MAWEAPLGVQHLRDLCRELVEPERFGQEVSTWIEDAVMHDGVAGIARRVDDLEQRQQFDGAIGKLASCHAGHDDVCEQQRHVLAGFDHRQSFRSAASVKDRVAQLAQRLDRIVANAFLVLDHHDDLARYPCRTAWW